MATHNVAEELIIAFCLNEAPLINSLMQKFSTLGPKIKFIVEPTFDLFLKNIAHQTHVDLFVIDEKFQQCQSLDLIDRLKKSKRYKKSTILLHVANIKKIDDRFNGLHIDFYFDKQTHLGELSDSLLQSIKDKKKTVIPKSYNVLILDDNPDLCEIVAMELEQLGHTRYKFCHSLKEALKCVDESDFDLMLLDWNLGDGTCLDLVEHVKNKSWRTYNQKALIIVVTGRDDVDDLMTLLMYGIKDTIIKPFDSFEFEDKLSYALSRHITPTKISTR